MEQTHIIKTGSILKAKKPYKNILQLEAFTRFLNLLIRFALVETYNDARWDEVRSINIDHIWSRCPNRSKKKNDAENAISSVREQRIRFCFEKTP